MFLQRVHALGGELSDSAQKTTHLVAGRVTRTVKFLASMSVVKHIVTPEWLEESWRSQKFVGRHGFLYICLCKDHLHTASNGLKWPVRVNSALGYGRIGGLEKFIANVI